MQIKKLSLLFSLLFISIFNFTLIVGCGEPVGGSGGSDFTLVTGSGSITVRLLGAYDEYPNASFMFGASGIKMGQYESGVCQRSCRLTFSKPIGNSPLSF